MDAKSINWAERPLLRSLLASLVLLTAADTLEASAARQTPATRAPVPQVQLEPQSLAFPPLPAGASSELETIQLVSLWNQDLDVASVELVGAGAQDFVLVLDTPAPFVLPAMGSVPLRVELSPATSGWKEARLEVALTVALPYAIEAQLTGLALGEPGAEVLVDAGGPGFVSAGGETWSADFGHLAGLAVSSSASIAGTDDPALYQTQREGGPVLYEIPLPAGTYEVTLHFAELDLPQPGYRVFDVFLQGELVLAGLDVFATAGFATAWMDSWQVEVEGGVLEVRLVPSSGLAALAGLEVRSVPVVTASPSQLEFGEVELGHVSTLTLVLTNDAPVPALIDSLELLIGSAGTAQSFTVELGGVSYPGRSTSFAYQVDATIPAWGELDVDVHFKPTAEQLDECILRLAGNFGSVETILSGSGGQGAQGSLHVVIQVPPVSIDYHGDGFAPVTFDGTGSHTHEPGQRISSYTWSIEGEVVATGALATVDVPIGEHEVTLTIADSHVPPNVLAGTEPFQVVPVTAVPGVLRRFYDSGAADPAAMLDSLPAAADWIEVAPAAHVPAGSTVGGSPFTGNVVVRMSAALALPEPGTYRLVASGGNAVLLTINGVEAQGPLDLAAGSHLLDARFAVDSTAQLPLEVQIAFGDEPEVPIPTAWLTHDQSSIPPLFTSMQPTVGTVLGGNQITINGFGFFPPSEVVVHWGGQELTGAALLEVEPKRIRLLSPSGTAGQISVHVETPQGTSEPRTFTYELDGPVPIMFTVANEIVVPQPTCAAWGPDGRLYVGSLNGTVTSIELDDDWNVVSLIEHPGVQWLSNRYILGITFSPHEPHDPPRAYVAHGELWHNGGGSFTGPSPYTGQVSVLEGPTFSQPVPLITQLPTSNHDHGVNGMVFDHNGDLLILVGGNTNAGVQHPAIGDVPESPLSAAVVKAELSRPDFQGSLSYVETTSGQPNDDQVFGEVVDLAPGSHVHAHAYGLRNSFDLVYTTSRRLYSTDNGPDFTYGPASTGPASEGPHPADDDELLLIEKGNYYGHPNRSRGRYDPRQNVYHGTSVPSQPEVFTQTMKVLQSSTNGIVEYRAQTFQGQMRGNLLVQRWMGALRRLVLSPDGRAVVGDQQIFSVSDGLGLETGPGGALFLIAYTGNKVRVLAPQDFSATGTQVHDVHPWRAPATGGTPFVIGGVGFGALESTSVTFDGIPAQVTSVTPTRIRGLVPAHASPPSGLVPIEVVTEGQVATLTEAFHFLGAPGTAPGWWEALPDAPASLGEVAAGVIDGVLYLVGEGPAGTYRYDLLQRQWLSELPARPHPGHHHGAETLDGKLYLIGGLHAGSEGTVQIFDPTSATWSLGAPMPWPAGSVSTAVIGGKIHACGGIIGSVTTNSHAVYDPQLDSWTMLASMPAGRNHTAAATDGEKLYVIGGRDGGNWVANGFNDLQIYDPATDTWAWSGDGVSGLAPLPQARGGMGKAVYYEGEIYVFGGETATGSGAGPGNVYSRVDVYRPATNTWRLEAPMPNPRHGIFPVLFQSRMFLPAGGTTAGFAHSTIFDVFTRQ